MLATLNLLLVVCAQGGRLWARLLPAPSVCPSASQIILWRHFSRYRGEQGATLLCRRYSCIIRCGGLSSLVDGGGRPRRVFRCPCGHCSHPLVPGRCHDRRRLCLILGYSDRLVLSGIRCNLLFIAVGICLNRFIIDL